MVARRPVRPTEAGIVLLDAEATIEATMSASAAELTALQQGTTGHLRLGAFVSAAATLVPPALRWLRVIHPGVQVTLRQLETHASHEALLRGDLDLAVTFDYTHDRQPAPDGIHQRLIRTDPVLAVLPVSHPLAERDVIDPADLAPDEWINTPVTALDRPGGQLAADVTRHRLDFEGDDFRTALKLVAQDLGVALLPELALMDAPATVTSRPLSRGAFTRYIYACRLDTRRVSATLAGLEDQLSHPATTGSPTATSRGL